MSLPDGFPRPTKHVYADDGYGFCSECGYDQGAGAFLHFDDTSTVLPDPPGPPADFGVDDSHLSVPCPECGSGVGYHCTGRFGRYYTGHTQRRALAAGAA